MEKCNIINTLNRRHANGHRSERKLLKLLLSSKQRTYKCSWTREMRNGVYYDGNIYLWNYSYWFQGCYCNSVPHFLKTNLENENSEEQIGTRSGSWRIKDTLVYESPSTLANDTVGLAAGIYNKCLFALTSDDYIIQYNLYCNGWKIRKKCYLGYGSSFKHLNYDCQLSRFVAKSKHYPWRDRDVVFYFVLFTTTPFEFIGCLCVQESIFGNVKDAFIINGLLVVLSDVLYRFYSVDYIIENYTQFQYRIGDTVDSDFDCSSLITQTHSAGDRSFGGQSLGLAVNVKIKDCPPCLFEVPCKRANGLTFGGFPWYCLVTYDSISKIYQVNDCRVVAAIEPGQDSLSTLDDEKKTYFHADRSGRLLTIEYDHIRCMKVVRKENKDIFSQIDTCYTISFNHQEKTLPKRKNHSRSGRLYKPINRRACTSLPSEIIHALDYEGDLDLLAVLYTQRGSSTSEEDQYTIGIYDNKNGELIRSHPLNTQVSDKDHHEWNLFLDGLLVICTLKYIGRSGTTEVFLYQLFEKDFNPI